MSKIVDITSKLSFEVTPSLKIKDKVLEVNADAPTMLKVMALMGDGEITNNQIIEMYNLIFPETARIEIEKLRLSFSDLIVLVQEAIGLVTGEVKSTPIR